MQIKRLGIIVGSMLAMLVVATAFQGTPAKAPDREVVIDKLLNEVQKGLSNAQQTISSSKLPPLESVTLKLETEVAKEGSAGFKILIFTFGKKWSRETAQTLTLTLGPPAPALTATRLPSLADQLTQAIVAAAAGVKAAAEREPPLTLQAFEATFAFVVQSSTNISVEFEIVPVTPSLSGDLTKTARHSITVTFKAV